MTVTTRAITAFALIGSTIAIAAYGPEIAARMIIGIIIARQVFDFAFADFTMQPIDIAVIAFGSVFMVVYMIVTKYK